MDNSKVWNVAERNFSRARVLQYLVGGKEVEAMALYSWNTDISAALWGSLGHLEVALRNAIDQKMSIRQVSLGRDEHWIFDNSRELGRDRGQGNRRHAQPYSDIDEAIRRVQQNRKRINPGQVISEISFGFCHQMVSKNQMFLWPDLAAAFPNMPGRSQPLVSDKVKSLRVLRNRIGHHHRIWAGDIAAKYAELIALATYIDPDLGDWINANGAVASALSQRPRIETHPTAKFLIGRTADLDSRPYNFRGSGNPSDT